MVSTYAAQTPAADFNGSGRWIGHAFESSVDLTVTHLRAWMVSASPGTIVGRLMDGGTTLVQQEFPAISATGWAEVELDPPIELDADHEYVVAFHAGAVDKPITGDLFESEYVNGPITVPAAGGRFRNSTSPAGGAIDQPADAGFFADFVATADGEPDPEDHDGDGEPSAVTLAPGSGTGAPAIGGTGTAVGVLTGPAAGTGTPTLTGAGAAVAVLLRPDGLSSGAESGSPRITGGGSAAGLVLTPGVGGPAVDVARAAPAQTFRVPAEPRLAAIGPEVRRVDVRA